MEESVAAANAKLDAGEVAAAVAELEALDQAHPGSAIVLEALAFSYAADQRPADSGETFLRRARLDFDGAPYFLYAGSALAQAGRRTAAAAAYREYLTAFPEDAAAWATLGRLLDDSNDPAAAVEAYLRSWEARPDPALALQLGDLFLRLRNAAQATTWYQRARESEDHAAPALVGLLEAALLARSPADAERWMQTLDAEHPRFLDQSASAARRTELTAWRQRQIEAEAAIARQREEQRRREEEEAAAARRAAEEQAARRAAEEEEARRAAEREIAPEVVATPVRTGTPPDTSAILAAIEASDPESAFDLLQDAIAAQPLNARLWAALAENALTRTDLRWAEAAALEAIRLDSAMPAVRRAWARVAAATLPPDRYLDELADLRRSHPDDPDLTLALARTLRDQGGPRSIITQLYRDFLRLAPRHPERAQAEAELAGL